MAAGWAASTTQHIHAYSPHHHTYACTVLADGLATEFTGRPPWTSLSSPRTCSVTQVSVWAPQNTGNSQSTQSSECPRHQYISMGIAKHRQFSVNPEF
eukprot:COSAG01_NODE_1413_length_10398_cov_73.448296_5_plen_98_part_00